ncbi:DMBT1 protein, partial [Galbula dea]|nr:DMBT1 protein [Galbula dea]
CQGTEAALRKCWASPWGEATCGPGEHAKVVCSVASSSSPLRLLDGPGPCAGRVEVFHQGKWGTVCDDHWDFQDAKVVCRQLGCGTVILAPHRAHFGQGQGPIWLDQVGCTGTEGALSECSSKGWGLHGCQHEEDASVVCSGISDLLTLRLANGSDSCSGRVEVFHDQRWGGILCDDNWDLKDAAVVCRQLGCGGALSAPGSARFGWGSGPIWLDDVGCTGEEEEIFQCQAKRLGTHNCHHGEDAGVVCAGNSSLVNLQLMDGPHRCAGRVEILHAGQWGTICDDNWDLKDAAVVCRQLGCGRAEAAPGRARFRLGTGPIWLDDVACSGNEENLDQCRARPWGLNNCHHGEDASVVCSAGTRGDAGDLRLAEGPNPCAGRVEVLHSGQWGTICDDHWDLKDAAVVCRQLGCGKAQEALGQAHFGQGTGDIWLTEVTCSGKEENLAQCPAHPWGQNHCHHGEDAGVICSG